MDDAVFQFGEWQISPLTNSILNGAERRQMEPRAMDVLMALCRNPQAVVSSEVLLEQCWGNTVYGDNPVHKTITQLRRVLGDTAAESRYIETIRKRGYRTVADIVVPQAQSAPAAWLEASPFRGLQAFFEDHAAIFFGRQEATARLLRAVTAQIESGVALQLVLGPSGSGKTSLIRAGLLPEMMRTRPNEMAPRVSSAVTLDAGEIGEHSLFVALGSALLDLESSSGNVFPGASSASLGQQLQSDVGAVIGAMQTALPTDSDGRTARFALFIDRLEALFTLVHVGEAERQGFLQTLATLARSRCVVVIAACRNDFYPRLAEYPLLMEVKQTGGHFDLAAPSHAEIGQIIRLPAQAAGLTFGRDPDSNRPLDEMLSDGAFGSPDALPLLQYTLQELYRLRTPANELSFSAFQQLGGVEGAIGHRAEEVVAQLDLGQAAALPRILSLIVTVSPTDDAVTGRRAPWSALQNQDERALVTTLVETRLFVSELVGTEPGFGVAHEALLRRWPRVIEWIDLHRHALRIRARIAQLTTRWVEEGKPADLLLPQGKQIEEGSALLAMPGFTLTADENALIDASQRRARLRNRLRLGAMSTIVVLALLAAGLGVSAVGSKKTAQLRRAQAEDLMGYMMGDFADKLRPLGRLELLDGVSTKALQYLNGTSDDDAGLAALVQRAKALMVIGEVRVTRGERPGAKEAFGASYRILTKQFAATPREPEVVKQLGINAFWLGQLALDERNAANARKFFEEYQHYSDQRALLEPTNPDAWIEQSYAHNTLGTLARTRGEMQLAETEFIRSIDLKKRARAAHPQDRTLAAELADSISWLATMRVEQGELLEAKQSYEQERQIVEALHVSTPSDALWTDRLVRALMHEVDVKTALGQNASALEANGYAHRLNDVSLRNEPDNRLRQFNQLTVQQHAYLLNPPSTPEARLATMSGIVERTHALTIFDPGNSDWSDLESKANAVMAGELWRQKQYTAAVARFTSASRYLADRLAKTPASTHLRVTAAALALDQAGMYQNLGDATAATTSCATALDTVAVAPADTRDFRVLSIRVQAYLCLHQKALAESSMRKLEHMGFRDANYLRAIAQVPHPL